MIKIDLRNTPIFERIEGGWMIFSMGIDGNHINCVEKEETFDWDRICLTFRSKEISIKYKNLFSSWDYNMSELIDYLGITEKDENGGSMFWVHPFKYAAKNIEVLV